MRNYWVDYIGSLMFFALLFFIVGFLVGACVMFDDTVPTRKELQEQLDTQQMRLDLVIDMLKASPRGEMNWDKL